MSNLDKPYVDPEDDAEEVFFGTEDDEPNDEELPPREEGDN